MNPRQLGPDPLIVSPVGLGCMGLSQGYGPADDDESVAAIRASLDLGVTLLDTAMSYGSGHNEELLGRALEGSRHDVRVATKFGIVRRSGTDGAPGVGVDGRPEHVRGYCEDSLRRLGVDVIDLYYLHRVDPSVPVADTVGAMAQLVADGLVRHLGVSEVSPQQLTAAHAVHPITAVQLEWSLLWRGPEDDVVPAARDLGVGIVAYSPLGRGLLTSTLTLDDVAASSFRSNDPRFGGDHLTRNRASVRTLQEIGAERGLTAGQVALAWLLARGEDVVAIPGSRHAARNAENAAAADVELDAATLARVEALEWAGDRSSFAAHGTDRSA